MNNTKFILSLFSITFYLVEIGIAAPLCLEKNMEKNTNEKVVKNEDTVVVENQENESQSNTNEDLSQKPKEESKDIEISADKKIEVDKENGVMIATGNAYVKEGVTSLNANILTAFSCETKDGDTQIIQINADGNVIIKSDQGNAFARRATYFVEKKIIELYDNVKLEKDGDIIVGDKGEFNVYTGKGEISVDPSESGGRKKVYGIIKSKKK